MPDSHPLTAVPFSVASCVFLRGGPLSSALFASRAPPSAWVACPCPWRDAPRVLRMPVSVLPPQPFVGQTPQSPPTPQRVPVNRLRAENMCHPHQLHMQPPGRGPRQPQDRPKPRVVLSATLSWTSHVFSPKPHQSHPTDSPPLPSIWPPPAVTTQLTKHIRLPWTHKTTVSSSSSLQSCLPLPSSLPPSVGLSFKNGLSPTLSPLPHGRSKAGTRRAEQCHAVTVTR